MAGSVKMDPLIYVRNFAALAFLLSLIPGGNSQFEPPSATSVQFLDECERTAGTDDTDIGLTCHLRTINSEFDRTNFSRISGSGITSLNIQCSDVLFYQSTLVPSSFSHISGLSTIHIEHCKLSRLPPGVFSGLGGLRNLTVRTHNTAWPALSLDVAAGAFDDLRLERIDLSGNNIWTFPERIFCGGGLEYLNVSENRLQDIGDLGFRVAVTTEVKGRTGGKTCGKSGMKILDISKNRLIIFPPKGLGSLTQLNELYASGNELSVLDAGALAGLKNLRILDLSNNKVVSLPSSLFQDSSEITEIYLQNNSLASLPPNLFAKLHQLLVLDISRNYITSLTPGHGYVGNGNGSAPVFHPLVRLVSLNLSFNRLSILSPSTFENLYSLQILDLGYNNIQTIEPHTFSPLKNLHSLILAHNSLTAIDPGSLSLPVLSLLSLNNNNISRIADTALRNCSSLKDLNLNSNKLAGIPTAIQNLSQLKTLDLGENSIDSLDEPKGGLAGLGQLYGLRLTGNRIVNVSKFAIEGLSSLKVLNLARNRIQVVEQGAFDKNTNLQAVRLDSNYISDVSGLFADSPNLIWLNISDNQLSWFDYSLIPKQLQWLDLHKNEISELGNYFGRQDLRLQTLDGSFNQIRRLSAANIPDSLEMIFLNDNRISVVEPHTFYNKSNLSRVDIFANQIETMDLSSLRLLPIPESRPVPEFYIGGNPIICDCNMEWLQRINKLDHSRQHPRIMDLDSVYCKLVYHREKYYVPLAEADPAQYLCSYKTHCFALCHCCDFDACDCEMTCPQNCTCYHDDTWSVNIVDCAAKHHTKIPARIPMDATEIYLDANNFEELGSHLFIGRKNLQVLYLNHSGIHRIANNSLGGLRRLSILHLEHNFLSELHGFEFEPLENLRELYLQGNVLQFIGNSTFGNLRNLEILKLDGNHLSVFPVWSLRSPHLVAISLHDNPWSCDCEYLSQFLLWATSNSGKIIQYGEINCYSNGEPYAILRNESQCTEHGVGIYPTGIQNSKEIATDLPVSMYYSLLAVIVVVCIILTWALVSICRGKLSLRIWDESKCPHPLKKCYQSAGHELEDPEKLFDAYVAYSLKDEVWVNRMIAVQLQIQSESPYRLCFHYRDFPAVHASEKILDAVESSKTTILILSKNFIQYEWIRFEFKSAIHSALRGTKRKLIAVTLGDLVTRDLDPDLRVALRSATILSANDKQFLNKLKCALPQPTTAALYSKSNSASRGTLISPVENPPAPALGHGPGNFHSRDDLHLSFGYGNLGGRQVYPVSSPSVSESSVPVFIPPFPPPNRPPPGFPTKVRGPPPPIPPMRTRK